MKKALCISTAVLFLTTFPLPQASWAAKAYTTDAQEIPMRSAAGAQNRVLLTIPKGSAVELVKTNEWTQVRYTPPDGKSKEGWVQSKFLESRPSESAAIKELKGENTSLREQLQEAEMARAALAQREREVSEKLTKLEVSYEELKGGAASYLKLKGEYDAARATLASTQESVQALIQENQGLKFTRTMYWFALGAVVFFAGLLVGMWFRRKRKTGPTYRL
ncbi:MAG TPA: TIGR04211 family SH3 domain-containing protein [Syntrophobacter fumaroxidans]|nr:TIGR04211 family SH3 domain-containing protein [Syntrophobacter fumaroxidans]